VLPGCDFNSLKATEKFQFAYQAKTEGSLPQHPIPSTSDYWPPSRIAPPPGLMLPREDSDDSGKLSQVSSRVGAFDTEVMLGLSPTPMHAPPGLAFHRQPAADPWAPAAASSSPQAASPFTEGCLPKMTEGTLRSFMQSGLRPRIQVRSSGTSAQTEDMLPAYAREGSDRAHSPMMMVNRKSEPNTEASTQCLHYDMGTLTSLPSMTMTSLPTMTMTSLPSFNGGGTATMASLPEVEGLEDCARALWGPRRSPCRGVGA